MLQAYKQFESVAKQKQSHLIITPTTQKMEGKKSENSLLLNHILIYISIPT